MPEQRFWLIAGIILLLAAALRLAALFSLRSTIYFDHLLYDELFYHNWAAKIADGTWHSTAVYEFAPLFAYVAAGVYKLFSANAIYIRYLNIGFGVLTCLGIGLVAREIGGRRLGLAAMLVAALYKPLILYSVVPLKTALSVMLFSMFMWFFLSGLNASPKARNGFLAGMAGGLMVNVRPNYLALIPVVVVFLLIIGYRDGRGIKRAVWPAALLLAGFGICISPFVIRNFRVAGKAALTASQAGFNFYTGNDLENKSPYYRPEPFASSSPFYQGVQFNIEASRRVGRQLSPRQASSFWIRTTLEQSLASPGAIAKKIGLKALAFFNRFEAADHYHIGFISRFAPFFRLPLFRYDLVLAAAMAGLAAGLAGNRKIFAAGLVFAVYGLTLTAFFCNARYRLPVLVILIPLAVYGIRGFIHSLQARKLKKAAGLMAVAGLALCVSWLPVTGTDDMTGYYNTHALVLSRQGRVDEAMGFWKISSDMKQPYSDFADLALAGAYWRKGDPEKTMTYLNKVSDHGLAAAGKYEFLGDLAVKADDYQKAAAHYRTSIRINSGQLDVRRKLIKVLESIDPTEAAGQRAEWFRIRAYYP